MQASMDGQEYSPKVTHPLWMENQLPWTIRVICQWIILWQSVKLGCTHKRDICNMKSTFYLTGHEITLRSDHLPLKKFLRKMTLNNTVNNWSTEIESFNINFVHISGKANVPADMLSR